MNESFVKVIQLPGANLIQTIQVRQNELTLDDNYFMKVPYMTDVKQTYFSIAEDRVETELASSSQPRV